MPKGRKVGDRFGKSKIILAELTKFLSPDRPVTLRYCLYQLVSRGIPLCGQRKGKPAECSTSDRCFTALSNLTRAARVSGELDDACFVDNRCEVVTGWDMGYETIGGYMWRDPRNYYRNRWQDQPKHTTEVWLEKDTTAVLLRDVVSKWDCTFRIAHGGYGRAFLYRAAKELSEVAKPITILYFGDFDPKGLDIERAARKGNDKLGDRRREGLFDILVSKFGWTEERITNQIYWQRIGATENDFRNPKMDRFKIPTKKDDSCAPAYRAKYGTSQCLEIEALEVLKVGELAERLEQAILRHGVDVDAWQASERREKREVTAWIKNHPAA